MGRLEGDRRYRDDVCHRECTSSLPGGILPLDNEALVQIIETVKSSTADVVRCQSWIKKIARHTDALPDSFILKHVVRMSQHPVLRGDFADVYIGQYEGKDVALKVLRTFNTQESKRTLSRVCSLPFLSRFC
jgi:hypothetical protein